MIKVPILMLILLYLRLNWKDNRHFSCHILFLNWIKHWYIYWGWWSCCSYFLCRRYHLNWRHEYNVPLICHVSKIIFDMNVHLRPACIGVTVIYFEYTTINPFIFLFALYWQLYYERWVTWKTNSDILPPISFLIGCS